jgi:hypothetical protein
MLYCSRRFAFYGPSKRICLTTATSRYNRRQSVLYLLCIIIRGIQRVNKRNIFILALFVIIVIAVRLTIKPINYYDYEQYSGGVQSFLNGRGPYAFGVYNMPPWSAIFLSPIGYQPIEMWLALSVALFVGAVLDLGTPAGLLQLLNPIFITLIASANPEWLMIGSGLWLLYRAPRGWGRGIAWLLLACKPQTSFLLLLADGWDALRERDWKPMALAAIVAVVSIAIFPEFFAHIGDTSQFVFSISAIRNFGIWAVFIAALIVAVRWNRRSDLKTMGLLLAPILAPYMFPYSLMVLLFTMRKAGWLRNLIFLVGCLLFTYLFWREYHVSEPIGAACMTVLAAILAPAYPKVEPATQARPAADSQPEVVSRVSMS